MLLHWVNDFQIKYVSKSPGLLLKTQIPRASCKILNQDVDFWESAAFNLFPWGPKAQPGLGPGTECSLRVLCALMVGSAPSVLNLYDSLCHDRPNVVSYAQLQS